MSWKFLGNAICTINCQKQLNRKLCYFKDYSWTFLYQHIQVMKEIDELCTTKNLKFLLYFPWNYQKIWIFLNSGMIWLPFPSFGTTLPRIFFLKNWEKKKKKFGRDCCSSSVEQVQGYVNVESELLQFVISLYAVQANIVLLTLNLIQILIDSPMKKKSSRPFGIHWIYVEKLPRAEKVLDFGHSETKKHDFATRKHNPAPNNNKWWSPRVKRSIRRFPTPSQVYRYSRWNFFVLGGTWRYKQKKS